MNLADLQKDAHAIAKAKGWWDEPRTFGDLMALVHSELSEALEAYREWGLSSSREILRRSLRRPSYRDESETGVECWFIRNEDTGELNYWEFEEYATSCKPECKPEGISAELADVVIRVAEHYGIELKPGMGVPERNVFGLGIARKDMTFGFWVALCHFWVTDAFNWQLQAQHGVAPDEIWHEGLAELITTVQDMAAGYGIDLDAAIWATMDYNRTRPHRHGGKAL